jgi:hypothetical protein
MSKEGIIDSLKPLFRKAKKDNLHFFCQPFQLYFTADELKEEHKKGKFIFHANHWQLKKKPSVYIKFKQSDINRIINRLQKAIKTSEGQGIIGLLIRKDLEYVIKKLNT